MPENGIPADLLKQLGGVPAHPLTPFETNLLNRVSAVTVAIYALTVQMEAGRLQAQGGHLDSHRADVEATAKHAQDAASLALKLAGALPLVEKLGAQEAGG